MTQPAVLMQSYSDEFDLQEGAAPNTPAIPGTVLDKGTTEEEVNDEEQFKYRSGTGKLFHMMK